MEVTSVISWEIAPVETLETQEQESHSEQVDAITSVSPLTWTLHSPLLRTKKRKKNIQNTCADPPKQINHKQINPWGEGEDQR